MKIPFTLEEWIKDRKRKVFTEEGKEFVVFNYQFDGFYPVRGHYKGNIDDIHCFNEKDLFIETEPELSEFEKKVSEIGLYDVDDGITQIKETAAELLQLARKELTEELFTSDATKTNLYKLGKAEALKDLPRWRKWEKGACGNGQGIPIAIVKHWLSGYKLVDVLGITGEQYIMLSDLEKLPGFNE